MTPWSGKHFRVNLDFSEHVERPYYNFKKITIADTFIWHLYLTLNKLHIFEKDFLKQNCRCMHTNESSILVYFKGWFETQFVYEKCVFPFKKIGNICLLKVNISYALTTNSINRSCRLKKSSKWPTFATVENNCNSYN